MKHLNDFLFEHGVITLIVVIWSMLIVSFATFKVFNDPLNLSGAAATAYAALLAIPPAAIGLYKWRQEND